MNTPHTSEEEVIDEIFDKLNGSGAHACYCERSVDGGCKCALKDEYLAEAKAKLQTLLTEAYKKGYVDGGIGVIND